MLTAPTPVGGSFAPILSLIILSIPFVIYWAIKKNKQTTSINFGLNSGIYCGLTKHILLSLLTFGIWPCIWNYRMTAYLNSVSDEEPRNPTTTLLLVIFVPFYEAYWMYKSAQMVDALSEEKGIASDTATLYLILSIFIPIIPIILMQDKVNGILTASPSHANSRRTAVPSASIGSADELKKYKELLDMGAITEEEYEAKKKQLLGL